MNRLHHTLLLLVGSLSCSMAADALPPAAAHGALLEEVRVVGRTVDEAGAPIAGAKIELRWAGEASGPLVATTDASGAFSFRHDKELGAPALTATAPGFRFGDLAAAQGEDLVVTGEPWIEVFLDLRAEDGRVPADAVVRFNVPGAGTEITTIPWRGKAEPIGVQAATAEAIVYADLLMLDGDSDGTPSNLISAPVGLQHTDSRQGPLTVDVYPRSVLKIEVLGGPDEPRENGFGDAVAVVPVEVAKGRAPDFELSRAVMDRSRGGGVRRLPTDGVTRYVFDLEPGDYYVGYVDDRFQVAALETIKVGDGITECELTIEDPEDLGRISVRCVGPDDEPLTGLSFGASVRTPTSMSTHGNVDAEESEPGVYSILRVNLVRVRPGRDEAAEEREVSLQVRGGKLGELTIEITDEQDEYSARFRDPTDLQIRVIGDNTELFHLRVSCKEAGFAKFFDLSKEEPITIESLQGERLIIEWIRANPQDQRAQGGFRDEILFLSGIAVHREEIDLATVQPSIAIEVPQVASLKVDASAFDGNSQVVLKTAAAAQPGLRGGGAMMGMAALLDSGMRMKLGEDGTVTFTALCDGDYVLSCGYWCKPLSIRMEGDTEVVLPKIEAEGIVVTVDDPLGTLGSVGFMTDDVIIGEDGEAFATKRDALRFYSACRKEPCVAWVDRGGSPIEIEMEPPMKAGEWGGTLGPYFPEED